MNMRAMMAAVRVQVQKTETFLGISTRKGHNGGNYGGRFFQTVFERVREAGSKPASRNKKTLQSGLPGNVLLPR